MRRALLACVLAAAAAKGAWAKGLSGIVSDPAGAVIAGTKVTLQCGPTTYRSVADQKGQFTFGERPSFEDCTLSVVQDGFAPYQRALGGESGFLEVKLKLAAVRETVSIRDSPDGTALESTTLSGEELEKVSNDPAQLTAYAEQLSGAAPLPTHIYIDGLPSSNLPPAELISTISVNQDPFSPEYSDGDENRVEIITRSPDRKLHFTVNGSSLGAGGNSALGPNLGSSSKWAAPILSGPVPHSPLAFSVEGNYTSTWSEQLVQAVTSNGGSPSDSRIPSGGDSESGSLHLYYTGKGNTRGGLSLYRSNATSENSGVGGLTLAEAGNGTGYDSEEMRATFQSDGGNWLQRSALLLDHTDSRSWANDPGAGYEVLGYFVSGGAPVEDEHSVKDMWMWKTVFQSTSARHFWESGVAISHSDNSDEQTPNPDGQIKFPSMADYTAALSGAATGTWLGTQQSGFASYGSTIASPFVQADIWRRPTVMVRAGLRGDYQSGAGIEASPRLSAISQVHRFILRGGAGVLVREWPNAVVLRPALQNAIEPFVSAGVLLAANGTGAPSAGNPLRMTSQAAPGLERPRTVMSKASVERPLGKFDPGIEFTWTNGHHLLGSRRIPAATGWLDLLESNRDIHRSELHPRLRYSWKGQSLTANYEWMHSRDDTDGPFSYAENYNDLAAEWARTTGVPVHNASLVANLSVPGSLFITILGAVHSSSPYNIITGKDVDNDGLFNDRGRLPRNTGNGPGYRAVSLFVSRRLGLGRYLGRHERGSSANVGLQVDDLLGNKNYLTVEAVEGSPLFGLPLSALPGRSMKLWFNLTR